MEQGNQRRYLESKMLQAGEEKELENKVSAEKYAELVIGITATGVSTNLAAKEILEEINFSTLLINLSAIRN